MKLRAMVFDDDVEILKLISSVLEMRGYEVRAYTDPRESPLIRKPHRNLFMQHGCCDLLISDVNMPGMNGFDLIENQNKNDWKVKNIALMSGLWTPAWRGQAEKLGCKMFDKPFKLAEINGWLNECEEKIQSERRLLRFSRAG